MSLHIHTYIKHPYTLDLFGSYELIFSRESSNWILKLKSASCISKLETMV